MNQSKTSEYNIRLSIIKNILFANLKHASASQKQTTQTNKHNKYNYRPKNELKKQPRLCHPGTILRTYLEKVHQVSFELQYDEVRRSTNYTIGGDERRTLSDKSG